MRLEGRADPHFPSVPLPPDHQLGAIRPRHCKEPGLHLHANEDGDFYLPLVPSPLPSQVPPSPSQVAEWVGWPPARDEVK